jgi:hypothetical protein
VEVEDVGSADARNRGDGGLGALGEEEVGVGEGEFFVAGWGGRIFVVTSFFSLSMRTASALRRTSMLWRALKDAAV